MTTLRGLLVDWGGVLTTAMQDCMDAFCEADGIDVAHYRAVMREWLGDDAVVDGNPAHLLERGELPVADFERQLAARLRTRDGQAVVADGLLTRMFAGFRHEPAMVSVVRRARRAGLRTALVSNSWGNTYPRDEWGDIFDAVVISGEVGLRKPEPAIYRHAAEQVGLAPPECVFVDDLAVNVRGAAAVGMVGVLHTEPETTVGELEALFGIRLAA